MKSYRENPEGEANTEATKQNEREAFAVRMMKEPKRFLVPAFLIVEADDADHATEVAGEIASDVNSTLRAAAAPSACMAFTFSLPHSGATDGQGDSAVVHLHYFTGGADWWITEKDAGSQDDPADEKGKQHQAFGVADLFGDGGELGYISIEEITAAGAELDFHWTPKTIAQVRGENEFAFPAQVDTEVSRALKFVEGLRSKTMTPAPGIFQKTTERTTP